MEIKTLFLIFGIALALMAVVVSFAGLRTADFPSRRAMFGLLGLALVMVAGTAYFAVELSVEEAEERDSHSEKVIGEEASATPLRVTPTV
jgi:hypothetical protein